MSDSYMMSDEYAATILSSIQDVGIIATDLNGNLVTWNEAARVLLELSDTEIGKSADIFFLEIDQKFAMWSTEMSNAKQYGKIRTYGKIRSLKDTAFMAEGAVYPLRGKRGEHSGFVKILWSHARRRENETELLAALQKDALTGLANRSAFDARFRESIAACVGSGQMLILHLIDLDHFKIVNDTLGHQAGDLLLKQVAVQIQKFTRKTDFVARLGGDEFGVLQIGSSDTAPGSALAEKIRESLSRPFDLGGSEAHISASIGIALCPVDGEVASELLRKADAALYRVKRGGRNGYSYFTNALDKEAHERARDVSALRESLQIGCFHLVYQAKVDLRTDRILGVEALLRCDHPVLSSRSIIGVIKLAKACGEIRELSKWILHTACMQTSHWFEQGHDPFKICVNFSARELSNPDVLNLVHGALKRSKLMASHLDLELTEEEVFESKDGGLAVLRELRSLGVAIALDDFGTGYSSLSYLMNLPVDIIKLDISFIRNVTKDTKAGEIVLAMINLAHALNLLVVAEGVEKTDQLKFFRKSKCDAVQGFLLGTPLPAEAMTKWMQRQLYKYAGR